jgi:hypothetical protein
MIIDPLDDEWWYPLYARAQELDVRKVFKLEDV